MFLKFNLILALIFYCNLITFAVGVGDKAPKIDSIKILNCKSIVNNKRFLYVGMDSDNTREIVQTLKISDIIDNANDINKAISYDYSVIIFWATWSPICRQVFPVLEDVLTVYKDDALFLLVSRENIEAMQKFKKVTKLKVPIMIDDQSRTSLAFMSYNQNYPTVFIVDDSDEIVWRGDLVDLERVLKNIKNGTFDESKEEKLAEYNNRLRDNIRKADINGILSLSQSILNIDKENKVACRAILYAFGLVPDKQGAINFVLNLIKEHPKSQALPLLLVDISIKNGIDRKQLNTVINNIIKKFPSNYNLHNQLYWLIFNNYRFAQKPIKILTQLNKSAFKNKEKIESLQLKAHILAAQGRIYYLTGQIGKALKLQKQATSLYKTPSLKTQSLVIEKYYQTVLNLKL